MSDHTDNMIGLVGSSDTSIESAAHGGVALTGDVARSSPSRIGRNHRSLRK
jgi:flavin-binding protein dodecin